MNVTHVMSSGIPPGVAGVPLLYLGISLLFNYF